MPSWPRPGRWANPTRSSPGTGVITPRRCALRAFGFDDAQLKPYFPLERMLAAAFDTAQRLFGIEFVERPDIRPTIPTCAPSRSAAATRSPWDSSSATISRAPRNAAARWMSAYRCSRAPAARRCPIIVNNNNFARAPAGEAHASFRDDVRTLFHEFGHGLHGLLSQVTFERLSGTQVLRDFVELPSQIFEHWAFEPEVLARHARHHATGEPIPAELVERLARGAALQPGLRGRGVHRLRAGGHGAARPHGSGRRGHRRVRDGGARAHRHAARDRDAPPPAAFRAPLRERGVCRRLLRVHVGRGAGRRRLRRISSSRKPFDATVAERLLRYVYSSGATRDPSEAYRAFRGRDRKSARCW